MKEFYYELTVTPNSYYDLYVDLLLSITNDAIEELDKTIIIRSEQSLEDVENGIEFFTKELQNTLSKDIWCDITSQKLKNEDWINKYKQSIKAIDVGKFFIHPSWIDKKEDKVNILINPALAFGSGHHETTYTCLEAISKYVKDDTTLLDVGTGSGILAIAASKVGAIVDICDTDPVSITNAKENFELNNTNCNKSWQGSAQLANISYDVVIANIVADVLIMIKNDLKKVLKSDGILILSGILDKYEEKVMKKYKEFKILQKIQKNEWITLVLTKDINEQ